MFGICAAPAQGDQPPTSSTKKMMMAQDSCSFMRVPSQDPAQIHATSEHTHHFSCTAVVFRVKHPLKFIAEERPKRGSTEEGGRNNRVS